MGRPRSKPIKWDADVGLALYDMTKTNNCFRLDYLDPFDGARKQPTRVDESDAFRLWDETVTYLRTARHAVPLVAPSGTRSAPTVRDLFDKRIERWVEDKCQQHYINTRVGRFDYRLAPVFGDQLVRDWASSSAGCREVIRIARVHGLAPSSIQDLGVLMRNLVTLGRELRWIQPGYDPMQGVKYTASATQQGELAEFVREDDRPEFAAVEALIEQYEEIAMERGILWLPVRALVAAHGGLRPGEQDALRISDLRADELIVCVNSAFSYPRRSCDGPIRKLPKNGKQRRVLLPSSTIERLLELAERRLAAGASHDSLLFEDPRRPGLPLSEAATRRLHIEAGVRAGWETVKVRRDPNAKRHLGPDLRPRHPSYSLRHHAAIWMHEVAGFDWTDVSLALGHHSVAFTLSVYVRSGAEAEVRNRERLRGM